MPDAAEEARTGTVTIEVLDDAAILRSVQDAPLRKRMQTYVQLTGPGWLQSAITLGGGSLASSLYLGVIAGYSMLWIQPLAMVLGIIMMSALGYVTLSTGERPLPAINRHVNPVLGWGWAAASLLASMVWALPQYTLADAVVKQNLLPGLLGPSSALGQFNSTLIVAVSILLISTIVTWNYGRGTLGMRIYEAILKVMVGVIVVAFASVIVRLMLVPGGMEWGAIFRGFIPNPALIFSPAEGFTPLLAELPAAARDYWSGLLVNRQQQVIAAAFATAVGINMTFLFGYSLLQRKWGPEFRGFMKFDLTTGMLVPFTLAIACVVIASASQFHTVPQAGFIDSDPATQPSAVSQSEFRRLLSGRLASETGEDLSAVPVAELDARIQQMDPADRHMAAVLVTRDAFDLARALDPITGNFFSRFLFGIGVLGMALSTITILMLISGMVVCEALNKPHTGWTFRLGTLMAGVGALGPFFWSRASFWLAIPTSVIALMFIPIAYISFFLLMNNKSLLGEHMTVGRSRFAWNTLMVFSLVVVISASVYMMWTQVGLLGVTGIGCFLLAAAVAHVIRRSRRSMSAAQPAGVPSSTAGDS